MTFIPSLFLSDQALIFLLEFCLFLGYGGIADSSEAHGFPVEDCQLQARQDGEVKTVRT